MQVSLFFTLYFLIKVTNSFFFFFLKQRLMAKDLDNWEQKRVERLKGEPDGRL